MRPITAAEAALAHHHYVSAIDAAVRHQRTAYYELLMGGLDRALARHQLRQEHPSRAVVRRRVMGAADRCTMSQDSL